MYKVKVIQEQNVVRFEFNKLCDAIEFASQCLEVGDDGTEISILSDNGK